MRRFACIAFQITTTTDATFLIHLVINCLILIYMNTYDKKTYEQDFPEHGNFNWKTVKLKTPTEPYYDGHKIIGVVLHDGNFMVNGVLFLENQYEIIDEDPLKLNCL